MTSDNEAILEMLRAFMAQQNDFNEYQRDINAAVRARLNGIRDELTEFKDEANSKLSGADARFERLANDAAEVKGGHPYIMTIQRPETVAERLGYYYDRALTAGELVDMTREMPNVIVNDGERESFLNADLVLKVKDKVDMLTHYIAIEISYTGQPRDPQRWILARVHRPTGTRCHRQCKER